MSDTLTDPVETPEEEVVKAPTKKEIAAAKKAAKLAAMTPEGTMVLCDDGEDRAVIYRETAIDQGLARYFTGEACRNGHIAERKVKGYVCTVCARLRQKARHKTRMLEDPAYRKKFTEKRAKKHKLRYASDPDYRQKILDKAKTHRARKALEKKVESGKGVEVVVEVVDEQTEGQSESAE